MRFDPRPSWDRNAIERPHDGVLPRRWLGHGALTDDYIGLEGCEHLEDVGAGERDAASDTH